MSTMAWVTARSLLTPSHYLNQCWLPINEVLWHSHESSFTASAQATILCNEFDNYTFIITVLPHLSGTNELKSCPQTGTRPSATTILTYHESCYDHNHSISKCLHNLNGYHKRKYIVKFNPSNASALRFRASCQYHVMFPDQVWSFKFMTVSNQVICVIMILINMIYVTSLKKR